MPFFELPVGHPLSMASLSALIKLCQIRGGCSSEGRLKFQTHKRFKRRLFIRTKYNMRIFGIIPFIKLQNDT